MEQHSEVLDWAQIEPVSTMIRRTVFQEEQGIAAGLDFDGRDPECRHCLVTVEGRAAGVARLEGTHIQRVAVLPEFRGRGVGTLLIDALIGTAAQQGLEEVVALAQGTSLPIFRRLGFEASDREQIIAGIAHWQVRRQIAARP
jgi:predicted GNAT family N-acyltransferase